MPTNTPITKEDLIARIELLHRKEKARRVIAIAIGDELHKAMDAWSQANTEYIAASWLDSVSDKTDQFNTAMKEWRDSVAELSQAREYLAFISK